MSTEPTVMELDIVTTMFEQGLEGGGDLHLMDSYGSGHKKADTKKGFSISSHRIHAKRPIIDSLLGHGLIEKDTSGSCRTSWHISDEGMRMAMGLSDALCPLDTMELLHWFPENLTYFYPSDRLDGRTAIPWVHTSPDVDNPGDCRLLLLLGDNAGGKSFFRRLLHLVTHRGQEASMSQSKVDPGEFPVHEFIHLSMEMRTGGGMGSSFVYGMESHHSTGQLSASTVHMGIKTASARRHTSIIHWDEPDLGMSPACAAGAGAAIRDFVENLPPLVQLVVVTTHSESMVRELSKIPHHYLHLGRHDAPGSAGEWLQRDWEPISPQRVQEVSRARFKDIQALLCSE